ncbi:hypothetical protein [Terribacillus saccharophilus]|jgi:hypothetical protein|nr:hypothetical protein [Terribacillus saccharophilus]
MNNKLLLIIVALVSIIIFTVGMNNLDSIAWTILAFVGFIAFIFST